jgi:hypothetical protein
MVRSGLEGGRQEVPLLDAGLPDRIADIVSVAMSLAFVFQAARRRKIL